jgi:hypothetical protein
MRISVKKEIVTMGIPSLNIEENNRGIYNRGIKDYRVIIALNSIIKNSDLVITN